MQLGGQGQGQRSRQEQAWRLFGHFDGKNLSWKYYTHNQSKLWFSLTCSTVQTPYDTYSIHACCVYETASRRSQWAPKELATRVSSSWPTLWLTRQSRSWFPVRTGPSSTVALQSGRHTELELANLQLPLSCNSDYYAAPFEKFSSPIPFHDFLKSTACFNSSILNTTVVVCLLNPLDIHWPISCQQAIHSPLTGSALTQKLPQDVNTVNLSPAGCKTDQWDSRATPRETGGSLTSKPTYSCT